MEITFPLGKSSQIAIVENFLTKEFCQDLLSFSVEHFDKLFIQGAMLGGLDTSYKNSFDWPIKTSRESEEFPDLFPKISEFDETIYQNLTESLNIYKDCFWGLSTWKELRDTNYRLQRYIKNSGFYKQHIDGAVWLGPNSAVRVLAVVIYLNDVTEGGATFFPEHDYRVEPKAGNMALFPAAWTHPHVAEMPLSEDKWIISTFITV